MSMTKTVGIFFGEVSHPHPCWCVIKDSSGNEINFNHKNISDLEYLLSEMKKAAIRALPDKHKNEV